MSAKKVEYECTARQEAFIQTDADEVLYGGAAGGGKTFGQFLDTVIYAGRYPGSKQIIFRRTYPELERSIIRTFQAELPEGLFNYNASKHSGLFNNGSLVDFGYIDNEKDLKKYQSAEYDVIRFDELTHFTEEMYVYMMSRLRGTTPFPRAIKSSTNPGGVGHSWVKQRFIDSMPPDQKTDFFDETGAFIGSRVFLPAKVQDNVYLMEQDPGYIRKLKNLNPREQKALLYGDWDLVEGRFFDEFDRTIHTIRPFFRPEEKPEDWEYYIAIDYGLDMLAALLMGVAPGNKYYAIDEVYEGEQHPERGHKGLIASEAAEMVKKLGKGYPIRAVFAPPDLWGKSKDTGRSIAEIFYRQGVTLTKVDNNRVMGWMAVKEALHPRPDEQGAVTADLLLFDGCRHLIRTLSSIEVDPRNPNDAAKEPHELTHAPDALRYFFAGRPRGKKPKAQPVRYDFNFQKKQEEPEKGRRVRPI